MTDINRLSALGEVSAGDQIPVYAPNSGDARRMSVSQLQAFILGSLLPEVKQNAAPSATGFNIYVNSVGASVWLIVQPAAGYAAGTITLPAGPVDLQELTVNCTQSVGTLTIAPNGAGAVTGAPTSLTANGFFKLKYELASNSWYRVA